MFFKNLIGAKGAKDRCYIARVSDLLESGFDEDYLIGEFVRINKEVWGNITESEYVWTVEKVKSQFAICPQLHYAAFVGEKMVATLTNMFTTEKEMSRKKTWLEKTNKGYLTTHIPKGQVGFGVDLSVTNKNEGIGDRMVIYSILVSLIGEGIKAVYLGARIPGYCKHKDIPVEEYVYAKKNGKPLDSQLRFYINNGFKIIDIIPEYMDDPRSLNYGVLIKWKNPLYLATRVVPGLRILIQFLAKSLLLSIPPKSKEFS